MSLLGLFTRYRSHPSMCIRTESRESDRVTSERARMAGGLPLVECGPPAAAADSLVPRLFGVRAPRKLTRPPLACHFELPLFRQPRCFTQRSTSAERYGHSNAGDGVFTSSRISYTARRSDRGTNQEQLQLTKRLRRLDTPQTHPVRNVGRLVRRSALSPSRESTLIPNRSPSHSNGRPTRECEKAR